MSNHSLVELACYAQAIIDKILDHPDYKKLLEEGYEPDLTIVDAHHAISELMSNIEPPSAILVNSISSISAILQDEVVYD